MQYSTEKRDGVADFTEAEKKFLSFKYTVNQSSFITSILNDTGILGSVEGSVNDLQVYPQRYEKFSNYFF
uniref:Lipoprotein n=1 Tax=Strongyloides venezuelensis TaxID=75913 RepID=A0A0K0G5S4_STRVS